MEQLRITIEGRVHDIGFRHFIKTHADRLRVRGFVKNTKEGVEVVCGGNTDAVSKMVALCKKGPLFAKVTSVKTKKEKAKEKWDAFCIEY